MNIPKTYSEAQSFLGTRASKAIKGKKATKVLRLSKDEIALVYHETNVVTWKSNGDVTLDSGGYDTSTTKSRMNAGSYLYIYQNNCKWFISSLEEGSGVLHVVFKDGMTFKQRV